MSPPGLSHLCRLDSTWAGPHQNDQYCAISTLALTDLIMRGDPQFPNYDREYARKARGYLNYWREHNYMNPF